MAGFFTNFGLYCLLSPGLRWFAPVLLVIAYLQFLSYKTILQSLRKKEQETIEIEVSSDISKVDQELERIRNTIAEIDKNRRVTK